MSMQITAKYLVAICALIGLTACPEKSPMTTNTKPAIVLANPPGTESIVLGMGCFWGAEPLLVAGLRYKYIDLYRLSL